MADEPTGPSDLPVGTVARVEGRIAVLIGKYDRHWQWLDGSWTAIPQGQVETLGRIQDLTRLSAVEAERDRYIELLAACPRDIEGHVCCDCDLTDPERMSDCPCICCQPGAAARAPATSPPSNATAHAAVETNRPSSAAQSNERARSRRESSTST